MKLVDPDTYVAWTRCEEPGDNPTWESQCGSIEQIGFGDNPIFHGFVGPDKILISMASTTFTSIKRIVEKEFQRTHHLEWEYDDD